MSAVFGERLILGQQEGPNLELVVFGDEFYSRYETLSGYTVVYDLRRGYYCFAAVENGHFVSTGASVSKPVPLGIRRHLKEDASVRLEKFRRRYDLLRPGLTRRLASGERELTRGLNQGLLGGRQVADGNVKGLTIIIEFQNLYAQISNDEVSALLNDDNYAQHGNFCSVNGYYKLMSSGALNYTNRVVGPVRLSQKQSYYHQHNPIKEALEGALAQFNIDLSEFDSRGEGKVDAVSLLYAGRTTPVYDSWLWPHNMEVDLKFNGHQIGLYTIQAMGRRAVDMTIGTFCHETGHQLCRFPDLYDYGNRDNDFEESNGMGYYCLMSYGNHLANGKAPAPLCAYLRDLARWCPEEIDLNNPGIHTAGHGEYNRVLRFSTDKPHEYFLIENRFQRDLDQALPSSGLAIYHCDTRGSNEWQSGTPDNHYQCALIQADGRLDLEHASNGGDMEDLYKAVGGLALDHETLPSSKEWDRTDSGLIVSEVGAAAQAIAFRTGAAAMPDTISESVVADLIIPDDNPAGITSELLIEQTGKLKKITVKVDITHTYRGDLEVVLISPSATEVVLHRSQGGRLDNLHLEMDSLGNAGLTGLVGEAIEGQWKLKVIDHLKDDVGRLDTWGLNLEFDALELTTNAEVSPALPIPDYDSNGITSDIDLSDPGNVREVTVRVAITHTYRGDLHLELISPTGRQVQLRSTDGNSSENLVATYNNDTTPALGTLAGESVAGTWRLHVSDLARIDVGVLDSWGIDIKR